MSASVNTTATEQITEEVMKQQYSLSKDQVSARLHIHERTTSPSVSSIPFPFETAWKFLNARKPIAPFRQMTERLFDVRKTETSQPIVLTISAKDSSRSFDSRFTKDSPNRHRQRWQVNRNLAKEGDIESFGNFGTRISGEYLGNLTISDRQNHSYFRRYLEHSG